MLYKGGRRLEKKNGREEWLVCVENNDDFVIKDGIFYGCYEFYKVDLKSDVVIKCCFLLLSDVSKGCMVYLGLFIYIIDDLSCKNYLKVIYI